MTTRTFDAQSTTLILDNTTENFLRYNVFPTADISYDFGTRNGTVIIHNTSTQHMLGDIKSDEVAEFTKRNGYWFKTILIEGNRTSLYTYTNTAPYNDAKLSVDLVTLTNIPDYIYIKNGSNRTDHTWTINFRPTRHNQELIIYNGNPANAHNIRINFGTTTAKVLGVIGYSGTSSTGGATGAGDPVAHTHATSDTNEFVLFEDTLIAPNKYITMKPETSLVLRGIKKPSFYTETSYFWTINHNLVNSALV